MTFEYLSDLRRKAERKILDSGSGGVCQAPFRLLQPGHRRAERSAAADRAGPAEEQAVKEAEGVEILKRLRDNMYVITLEVKGKELSSEKLAEKIDSLAVGGRSNIAFVIGGSLGLSEEVSKRSDFRLSFSQMTFPHQMMRVILLEQVYRSFKIIRHETYHK